MGPRCGPSSASPTGTFTTSPVPKTASPASTLVAASSNTQPDQIRIEHAGETCLTAFKSKDLVKPHIAQARDHRDTIANLLDTSLVFGAGAKGCVLLRRQPLLAAQSEVSRGILDHLPNLG